MNVICIVGDARSGSSLLQGLLELHGDVAAVGELRRLETFLGEGRLCACGEPVTTCAYWQDVLSLVGLSQSEVRTQPPGSRLGKRYDEVVTFAGIALGLRGLSRRLMLRGRVVADHSAELLIAAAERASARVIVDSSKDPGHAAYLLHQNRVPVHIAFMVRDGRGTVWSKMQRTGMSVEVAAQHWRRTTTAMLALQRVLGPQRSTWIRYEELCGNPRAIIGQLLGRFQLSEAGFAKNTKPKSHRLGGSPGVSHVTFDTVRQDTAWQREMPAPALRLFEAEAGALNRRLGYG